MIYKHAVVAAFYAQPGEDLMLKGEDGVHGNYIVDHGNHGKIMELCF